MKNTTPDRQLAISVNDKPLRVPFDATVSNVLSSLGLKEVKDVIVTINGVFLRSADLATQHLLANDRVTVMGASL